jgi:hypothetical protein
MVNYPFNCRFCSDLLSFAFCIILIYVLYYTIILLDYQLILLVASLIYENNLEEGFAISLVKKMSNPFTKNNILFGVVMFLCFMWGILESSKLSDKLHLFNDCEIMPNITFTETIVKMLILIIINLVPIAFFTTEYCIFSIFDSQQFIPLILFLTFYIVSIMSYYVGKHVNPWLSSFLK